MPAADRASFLAAACEGNDLLRQNVERLLAADARLGSVLDREIRPVNHRSVHPQGTRYRLSPSGTTLGPYVIDALVGAGGMGEVYQAHDTRLGRTVAVKGPCRGCRTTGKLAPGSSVKRALSRRSRILTSVRSLDLGREGDRDYLVMEYLRGETLAERG